MTPEEVLEAIEQVRPSFRGPHNVTAYYRACIERGLLQRDRIAPNTFRRVVNAHELLKPDAKVTSKRRLAFAKAHANELWQADTMFGPYGAIQAHRVPRRRQPCLLPRRILPRRQHRMKPIDRFGLDLGRIRFLPPSDVNEELCFVEQPRTVLADNTFSLKNTRFEAPRDLRNRKIQFRFDRLKFDRAIAYFKGERMGEAHPVDSWPMTETKKNQASQVPRRPQDGVQS